MTMMTMTTMRTIMYNVIDDGRFPFLLSLSNDMRQRVRLDKFGAFLSSTGNYKFGDFCSNVKQYKTNSQRCNFNLHLITFQESLQLPLRQKQKVEFIQRPKAASFLCLFRPYFDFNPDYSEEEMEEGQVRCQIRVDYQSGVRRGCRPEGF